MEIEEGDLVVTPEPEIREYEEAVMKGAELGNGWTVEGSCVPVNAPIRVRVSNEAEAECLVELAEGCGFVKGEFIEEGDVNCVEFVPNEYEGVGQIFTWSGNDLDLTFESDYAQIKRWLEYHWNQQCQESVKEAMEEVEPELEDDRCPADCDEGEHWIEGYGYKDCGHPECPYRNNCTDNSSEPRPKDDIFDVLRDELESAEESYPEPNPNFRALISEVGELAESLIDLERYEDNAPEELVQVAVMALRVAKQKTNRVKDLKSELEDVREERDELKEERKRLVGYLKQKSEAFNDELIDSEGLASAVLGCFVSYDDFLSRIQSAWDEDHNYLTDPLELISDLTNERDDLRERIEEAREYISDTDRNPELSSKLIEVYEILTPDSDEDDQ